jgi:hypothetical protein
MIQAVEDVKRRLLRATDALEAAGVPYAVIGDFAVAAWIARLDEAAVRNTSKVELLLERNSFELAKEALRVAGFFYHHGPNIHVFLDGPHGKLRNAVRFAFAGEKVQPDDLFTAPPVHDVELQNAIKVLTLEALVKMHLTSFRTNERVNLRDMLDVVLLDESWLARLPPELAARLQELLDNPEG